MELEIKIESSPLTGSVLPVTSSLPPFSVSDLQCRIGELIVRALQEITEDTLRRQKGCQKNRALLNAGVYCSNDYYELLKQTPGDNAKKRLEIFIEQGAFFQGKAPKEYFERIKDKDSVTGNLLNGFQVAKGKLPSEALASILGPNKKLTLVSCIEVCQLAYIKALLDVLGEEKFNKIFAADGKYPLSIGAKSSYAPFLMQKSDPTDVRVGDWLNVLTHPLFLFKHWNSDSRGIPILFQGGNNDTARYVGFGLPPRGVSYQEILEICAAEYNKKPIHVDAMSTTHATKFIEECSSDQEEAYEQLKNSQIHVDDVEKFQKQEKKQFTNTCRWNADRIHQLLCASPDNAYALMHKWDQIHKQRTARGASGPINPFPLFFSLRVEESVVNQT